MVMFLFYVHVQQTLLVMHTAQTTDSCMCKKTI